MNIVSRVIALASIAIAMSPAKALADETHLKAFRTGKREHEMMSVIAKDLSDGDITSVAQWYSSIKITVQVPE